MNQGTTFTAVEAAVAIKTLARAGKTLSRHVESLLVMAVYFSVTEADKTKAADVANGLLGALRASTKRDGIIAFLEKFGCLYHKGGKTGFVHFALGAQKNIEWTSNYSNEVQDEAMNWESFKPAPKEAEPLDLIAMVAALVKRTQKDGATLIDGDLVPYLNAAVALYSGKKALAAAATSSAVSAEVKELEAAINRSRPPAP